MGRLSARRCPCGMRECCHGHRSPIRCEASRATSVSHLRDEWSFAGSGLFWIALGFFGDGPVWMVVVVVVVAFAIAFVLWAPATFLLAEGVARSGWPGSRWFTRTEVILVRLVEIRGGPFEVMLVLADGVEHRLAIINGAVFL